MSIGLIEPAIAHYERALVMQPSRKYLLGMRRHAQMHICQWSDFSADIDLLTSLLSDGHPAAKPFVVLALIDSLALQRRAAEIWVREECPADASLGLVPIREPNEKIRIGYFSADFRPHPVALLIPSLIEGHDRSRFEVFGFSFGADSQDPVRQRLKAAFDHFIDVDGKTHSEVAALARDLGIDIAVDLGGFTVGSPTEVFALRAAPLQISYLGYLGTMGAPYIDYLVADAVLIPDESRRYYSEKIVYLPSYQANDSKRKKSEQAFSRAELGLPDRGFVYSCFNATYKLTPRVFDTWMNILRRVEGSCLFLYVDNSIAQRNLREHAERHGIAAERLVFGDRIPLERYLARFCAMDLFLDTMPYNAGTTASDALWAGLPILTCLGESFAGRMAASLLTAIGLPELITKSLAEYEELAVRLALDAEEMRSLRDKLALNKATTRLFDTAGFTKSIESAYTQIYQRLLANLPPDHVYPAKI